MKTTAVSLQIQLGITHPSVVELTEEELSEIVERALEQVQRMHNRWNYTSARGAGDLYVSARPTSKPEITGTYETPEEYRKATQRP